MKKIIILLLTLLIMLVSTAVAKPISSSLPAFVIPENARWIIHLDMKKFNSTRISDLVKEKKIHWIDYINYRMVREYKLDLVNDTAGITIFGLYNRKQNNVVCISGNFDRKYIVSKLEHARGYQKDRYGKYTIHRWRDTAFCTFVNDNLVMYSLRPMNDEAFEDVLNTILGKKRDITGTDMMATIKHMPKDAFLIAVSENISALANKSHTSMILSNTAMAFFMASERNENLRLNLKLITDTPETATNIQQIVNGFIALARMKHNQKNFEWNILDNLKVRQDRNVLQFELEYPSKHFIKMADYWGDCY